MMAGLRAPEAYRANQSPPLMPAQPKNAKQATCNRRRLRNGRATYLDVIEYVLDVSAI
jgi:hypothetical protein